MDIKKAREAGAQAIEHFGFGNQVDKCKEELIELLIELKQLDSEKRIVDELADVIFMCIQISDVLGWDQISERLDFKIERLKKRMEDNQER